MKKIFLVTMLSLSGGLHAAEYINSGAPWDYVYCGEKDGKSFYGSCSTAGRSVEIHKVRDTVIKFVFKQDGAAYGQGNWFFAKQDGKDKNTYHVVNLRTSANDDGMVGTVVFYGDEQVIFKTWKASAPNDLENMTQETFFLTYAGE